MDHFEVFGLPRRLAVDTAELQRKFYELSRRYHPDFHQAAPPEEQVRALEASAGLNAAYRTLRDPIARIEYLVRLEEGRDTKEGATVKPKAPPELLEEMFEIQERSEEHTSELQSLAYLVCRLLLEKKKIQYHSWTSSKDANSSASHRTSLPSAFAWR